MDKLKMQTSDKVSENVERIAALFPNCVTESIGKDGKTTKVVDFDLLRQELSDVAVEGTDERYQFTWADKKKSILLANSPVSKTLRPCREESVNFDATKNLYIEGDNLEVLKLLQETYLGKIKMIYIDPPYNTGNDFVYEDDFAISTEEYFERSGASDEEGNRLFQNNDSNGRFHTDWLNMIYPRLKLARDLLTDDGVIFISIDDNEVHNLRKICDEVFGSSNVVAELIWRGGKRNAAKFISTSHEYMLVYAKSLNYCHQNNIIWREKKKGLNEIYAKVEEFNKLTINDYTRSSDYIKKWYKTLKEDNPAKDHGHYCNIDSKGIYCSDNISRMGGGKYTVKNPINGCKILPPTRGWVFGKEEDFWKAYENGLIMFLNNDKLPILKRYLHDNESQLIDTVFYKDRRGSKIRLENLMGDEVFDFPKDETVLYNLINAFTINTNDIILDFFSGSATTAHAVIQLNVDNNGNRKFIMVQLPEETSENSEARKAGYKNICEIGKERIRRAGRKIVEENKLLAPNIDIGFRVLKIDSSNMKPVFYNPDAAAQDLLSKQEGNIKEDRTPEDLLFQVMLDMGVDLSSSITVETIGDKKIFTVGDNNLICCFDKDVTKETVTEIAKRKPLYAVFRDSSFERDDIMVSFDQIFETYSPTTERRII